MEGSDRGVQLVVGEVSRIQSYIFGTNKLRENIGASYLVAQATEDWPLEIIEKIACRNNILDDTWALNDNKCIEDEAARLDAEILYAGGGNFSVLFREENTAKEFIQKLSRKVLTEAPGLRMVIAMVDFQWGESLAEKVGIAMEKLEEKKRSYVPSAPLLGLGVTAICSSTGLPAVGLTPQIYDEPGYLASAEILAKVENAKSANKRLKKTIHLNEDYEYPEELDQLGRSSGEYSHIAVIHIDGNDMGQRKKKIGIEYKNPENNRDYIRAIRAFSKEVKEASKKAMEQIIQKLITRINEQDGKKIISHYSKSKDGKNTRKITEIELAKTREEKFYLLMRPIVYGGDEVTFVCDGRLGLSLAIEYMRNFEKETEIRDQCRGKITVCSGIAIVKAHHPFSEAYKLSDELCSSAKRYWRKNKLETSCMDWQFVLSGFAGSIEEIRRREYRVTKGSLTLRPVTLGENPDKSYRTWEVVRRGIKEFQSLEWLGKRNKIKALREALRDGGEAVEHYLTRYELGGLPDVEQSQRNWPKEGWQDGYCGYFDAIELMDWFIPLEEDEE